MTAQRRTGAAEPAVLIAGATVLVAMEFVVIGLAPAMGAALGRSASEIGLLVTLFAASSALLGPPLTVAAGRLSAPSALGWALAPFAANLLLAAAPSFALAAALRVIQGATLPVFISIAAARLARTHGAGRGSALLYYGVTLGGAGAPPFALYAAERFGWQAPVLALGLAAALVTAFCFRLRGAGGVRSSSEPISLARRSRLVGHLALTALIFASMFCVYSYVATILETAGLGSEASAAALLLFGAAGLLGNWLGGEAAGRPLIAACGVLAATALAPAAILALGAPTWPALAPLLGLWGAAHAAGFVLSHARAIAVAPAAPELAGALNIAAANLGIALGAALGGAVIAGLGLAALPAAAACLATLALGVALGLRGAGPVPRTHT